MQTIAGPKEGCHTMVALPSSTSLMAEQKSRCVDLCDSCMWQSPQKKVVIIAGSLQYYMIDIDNLNFGTNPIKRQSAQRKIVLLHRT